MFPCFARGTAHEQPITKLVVDTSRDQQLRESCGQLCERLGWRHISTDKAADDTDWLRHAVTLLDSAVEVVFVTNVDVWVSDRAVRAAGLIGLHRFCTFAVRQAADFSPPDHESWQATDADRNVLPYCLDAMAMAFPTAWCRCVLDNGVAADSFNSLHGRLQSAAEHSIGSVTIDDVLLVRQTGHGRKLVEILSDSCAV